MVTLPLLVRIVSFSSLTAAVASFGIPPPSTATTCTRPFQLYMNGRQEGARRRPANEFSRTVAPDVVLKRQGKHKRSDGLHPVERRQCSVEVEASADECRALALRFALPAVERLEARLSLSPEGGSGGVDDLRGMLVEGSAQATVTRTCVRTNEPFREDVEFAIRSIVRPVTAVSAVAQSENGASLVPLSRGNIESKNKKKKNGPESQSLYGMDEIEAQEMIQLQSISDNLERMNEDYDDILMEDEAIFATNGMLDVGELVAQLFWLQLDPYPKKPGGPEILKFSITG